MICFFFFLAVFNLAITSKKHHIHVGFNSIELSPKETFEINKIDPQSFFLFTNPDPRIFKLEIRKNNEFISEPFINNGPILDLIKSGKKDKLNNNNIRNSNNGKYNNDNNIQKNAKLISFVFLTFHLYCK